MKLARCGRDGWLALKIHACLAWCRVVIEGGRTFQTTLSLPAWACDEISPVECEWKLYVPSLCKAFKKQVCFLHLDAGADGDGRATGQKEAGPPRLCGGERPAGQEHPLCTVIRTINKLLLP